MKVIAGEYLGVFAAIETKIPIMFLDIALKKGASIDVPIPDKYNAFVYVWRGEGLLGGEKRHAVLGQV